MFERVARLSLFLRIAYVHTFDTHTFGRKSLCAGVPTRPAESLNTGRLPCGAVVAGGAVVARGTSGRVSVFKFGWFLYTWGDNLDFSTFLD